VREGWEPGCKPWREKSNSLNPSIARALIRRRQPPCNDVNRFDLTETVEPTTGGNGDSRGSERASDENAKSWIHEREGGAAGGEK